MKLAPTCLPFTFTALPVVVLAPVPHGPDHEPNPNAREERTRTIDDLPDPEDGCPPSDPLGDLT